MAAINRIAATTLLFHSIVGTFQYMPPEQVERKEVYGRSVIFSLGAALYEMLTGRRAFKGKSFTQRGLRHMASKMANRAST